MEAGISCPTGLHDEIALDVQVVQDSVALADGNLVTVVGTFQMRKVATVIPPGG